MADLPSLFNRLDFFSVLLPGYVAVLLCVLLFIPEILEQKKIEADLFSTVILIIAGPSIGSVLRAFHRFFPAIYYHFKDRQVRTARLNNYAVIRIKFTADQLGELDKADSEYDFRMSTALALFLIGISHSLYIWKINPGDSALMLVSFLLFYGGYLVYKQRWIPLFNFLITPPESSGTKI